MNSKRKFKLTPALKADVRNQISSLEEKGLPLSSEQIDQLVAGTPIYLTKKQIQNVIYDVQIEDEKEEEQDAKKRRRKKENLSLRFIIDTAKRGFCPGEEKIANEMMLADIICSAGIRTEFRVGRSYVQVLHDYRFILDTWKLRGEIVAVNPYASQRIIERLTRDTKLGRYKIHFDLKISDTDSLLTLYHIPLEPRRYVGFEGKRQQLETIISKLNRKLVKERMLAEKAKINGIDSLYQKLSTDLWQSNLFDYKRATLNALCFSVRSKLNRSVVIMRLNPARSNQSDGVKYDINLEPFSEHFNFDQSMARSILPNAHEHMSKGNLEVSGFFHDKNEVESFLYSLNRAKNETSALMPVLAKMYT